MIPFRTPFILPLVYPTLLWRQPREEKTLYLTFDDGPVPGPTEFVLDTLLQYNIKATFFCIGDNVRKHPEIFRKVLAGGHAIGNHTFNHLNGWKTNSDLYLKNIAQCDDVIEEQDRKPVLFRPPYGRITFAQVKQLTRFKIVMWDVLTHDYNKSMSAGYCLKKSIRATRNGSIVVFHDSVKAERNMKEVLPKYIEHFAAEGFSFKPITA